MQRIRIACAAALVLTLAACGDRPAAGGNGAGAAPTMSAAPDAAPTGEVIEVRMITDEQGNRFEPSNLTARTGDVIRLMLVSGVHNLHFLPDSNPGAAGLPPASDLLQLPGQTFDIPVSMTAGSYFFQCDPHAALGMTGNLVVQE